MTTVPQTLSCRIDDVFEVELSHVPGGDDEIPLVVTLCVSAIERKGGAELEGMYRIPGIKGEIEKLRMHFSYGRPNLDDEGGYLSILFDFWSSALLTQTILFYFIEQNGLTSMQLEVRSSFGSGFFLDHCSRKSSSMSFLGPLTHQSQRHRSWP